MIHNSTELAQFSDSGLFLSRLNVILFNDHFLKHGNRFARTIIRSFQVNKDFDKTTI
jgi:hypothetical protein